MTKWNVFDRMTLRKSLIHSFVSGGRWCPRNFFQVWGSGIWFCDGIHNVDLGYHIQPLGMRESIQWNAWKKCCHVILLRERDGIMWFCLYLFCFSCWSRFGVYLYKYMPIRATPRVPQKYNPQNSVLRALLNNCFPKTDFLHSSSLIFAPKYILNLPHRQLVGWGRSSKQN